jgi:hypothetical protein
VQAAGVKHVLMLCSTPCHTYRPCSKSSDGHSWGLQL